MVKKYQFDKSMIMEDTKPAHYAKKHNKLIDKLEDLIKELEDLGDEPPRSDRRYRKWKNGTRSIRGNIKEVIKTLNAIRTSYGLDTINDIKDSNIKHVSESEMQKVPQKDLETPETPEESEVDEDSLYASIKAISDGIKSKENQDRWEDYINNTDESAWKSRVNEIIHKYDQEYHRCKEYIESSITPPGNKLAQIFEYLTQLMGIFEFNDERVQAQLLNKLGMEAPAEEEQGVENSVAAWKSFKERSDDEVFQEKLESLRARHPEKIKEFEDTGDFAVLSDLQPPESEITYSTSFQDRIEKVERGLDKLDNDEIDKLFNSIVRDENNVGKDDFKDLWDHANNYIESLANTDEEKYNALVTKETEIKEELGAEGLEEERRNTLQRDLSKVQSAIQEYLDDVADAKDEIRNSVYAQLVAVNGYEKEVAKAAGTEVTEVQSADTLWFTPKQWESYRNKLGPNADRVLTRIDTFGASALANAAITIADGMVESSDETGVKASANQLKHLMLSIKNDTKKFADGEPTLEYIDSLLEKGLNQDEAYWEAIIKRNQIQSVCRDFQREAYKFMPDSKKNRNFRWVTLRFGRTAKSTVDYKNYRQSRLPWGFFENGELVSKRHFYSKEDAERAADKVSSLVYAGKIQDLQNTVLDINQTIEETKPEFKAFKEKELAEKRADLEVLEEWLEENEQHPDSLKVYNSVVVLRGEIEEDENNLSEYPLELDDDEMDELLRNREKLIDEIRELKSKDARSRIEVKQYDPSAYAYAIVVDGETTSVYQKESDAKKAMADYNAHIIDPRMRCRVARTKNVINAFRVEAEGEETETFAYQEQANKYAKDLRAQGKKAEIKPVQIEKSMIALEDIIQPLDNGWTLQDIFDIVHNYVRGRAFSHFMRFGAIKRTVEDYISDAFTVIALMVERDRGEQEFGRYFRSILNEFLRSGQLKDKNIVIYKPGSLVLKSGKYYTRKKKGGEGPSYELEIKWEEKGENGKWIEHDITEAYNSKTSENVHAFVEELSEKEEFGKVRNIQLTEFGAKVTSFSAPVRGADGSLAERTENFLKRQGASQERVVDMRDQLLSAIEYAEEEVEKLNVKDNALYDRLRRFAKPIFSLALDLGSPLNRNRLLPLWKFSDDADPQKVIDKYKDVPGLANLISKYALDGDNIIPQNAAQLIGDNIVDPMGIEPLVSNVDDAIPGENAVGISGYMFNAKAYKRGIDNIKQDAINRADDRIKTLKKKGVSDSGDLEFNGDFVKVQMGRTSSEDELASLLAGLDLVDPDYVTRKSLPGTAIFDDKFRDFDDIEESHTYNQAAVKVTYRKPKPSEGKSGIQFHLLIMKRDGEYFGVFDDNGQLLNGGFKSRAELNKHYGLKEVMVNGKVKLVYEPGAEGIPGTDLPSEGVDPERRIRRYDVMTFTPESDSERDIAIAGNSAQKQHQKLNVFNNKRKRYERELKDEYSDPALLHKVASEKAYQELKSSKDKEINKLVRNKMNKLCQDNGLDEETGERLKELATGVANRGGVPTTLTKEEREKLREALIARNDLDEERVDYLENQMIKAWTKRSDIEDEVDDYHNERAVMVRVDPTQKLEEKYFITDPAEGRNRTEKKADLDKKLLDIMDDVNNFIEQIKIEGYEVVKDFEVLGHRSKEEAGTGQDKEYTEIYGRLPGRDIGKTGVDTEVEHTSQIEALGWWEPISSINRRIGELRLQKERDIIKKRVSDIEEDDPDRMAEVGGETYYYLPLEMDRNPTMLARIIKDVYPNEFEHENSRTLEQEIKKLVEDMAYYVKKSAVDSASLASKSSKNWYSRQKLDRINNEIMRCREDKEAVEDMIKKERSSIYASKGMSKFKKASRDAMAEHDRAQYEYERALKYAPPFKSEEEIQKLLKTEEEYAREVERLKKRMPGSEECAKAESALFKVQNELENLQPIRDLYKSLQETKEKLETASGDERVDLTKKLDGIENKIIEFEETQKTVDALEKQMDESYEAYKLAKTKEKDKEAELEKLMFKGKLQDYTAIIADLDDEIKDLLEDYRKAVKSSDKSTNSASGDINDLIFLNKMRADAIRRWNQNASVESRDRAEDQIRKLNEQISLIYSKHSNAISGHKVRALKSKINSILGIYPSLTSVVERANATKLLNDTITELDTIYRENSDLPMGSIMNTLRTYHIENAEKYVSKLSEIFDAKIEAKQQIQILEMMEKVGHKNEEITGFINQLNEIIEDVDSMEEWIESQFDEFEATLTRGNQKQIEAAINEVYRASKYQEIMGDLFTIRKNIEKYLKETAPEDEDDLPLDMVYEYFDTVCDARDEFGVIENKIQALNDELVVHEQELDKMSIKTPDGQRKPKMKDKDDQKIYHGESFTDRYKKLEKIVEEIPKKVKSMRKAKSKLKKLLGGGKSDLGFGRIIKHLNAQTEDGLEQEIELMADAISESSDLQDEDGGVGEGDEMQNSIALADKMHELVVHNIMLQPEMDNGLRIAQWMDTVQSNPEQIREILEKLEHTHKGITKEYYSQDGVYDKAKLLSDTVAPVKGGMSELYYAEIEAIQDQIKGVEKDIKGIDIILHKSPTDWSEEDIMFFEKHVNRGLLGLDTDQCKYLLYKTKDKYAKLSEDLHRDIAKIQDDLKKYERSNIVFGERPKREKITYTTSGPIHSRGIGSRHTKGTYGSPRKRKGKKGKKEEKKSKNELKSERNEAKKKAKEEGLPEHMTRQVKNKIIECFVIAHSMDKLLNELTA